MKFKYLKVDRGELWVAKVAGKTVSYGWTWISPNSGAAFARSHGTSSVRFEIKVERLTESADGIQHDSKVVVEEIVGRVKYARDARSVARKYIREGGKAQAEAVAEAVALNSIVGG